jgi:hypothetical protein
VLVPSLGLSKANRSDVEASTSSLNNVKSLDDKLLKESRLKILKLFDSIFLLDKVPFSSFLEFLKLHVSERCAVVVQEFSLQRLLLELSPKPPSQNSENSNVDVKAMNVSYGRPISRSYLKLLCTLRFEFLHVPAAAAAAAADDWVPDKSLLKSQDDVSAYCSIDRGSASTFLSRYLLSSTIKQSTVGRILKLSQVFVFNDPKDEEKDEVASNVVDILSGEERVKRIEYIVHETEVIISNIKSSLDENLDGQFKFFDARHPNAVSSASDRSLSNCVHTFVMAIEDIQEKIKVVDLALQFTSSSLDDGQASISAATRHLHYQIDVYYFHIHGIHDIHHVFGFAGTETKEEHWILS